MPRAEQVKGTHEVGGKHIMLCDPEKDQLGRNFTREEAGGETGKGSEARRQIEHSLACHV